MMKNNFIRKIRNSICLLLVICSSNFFAQTNTLSPAKIVNAKPTASEILQALNGGGLTLSNPNIVVGAINVKNGHNEWKEGSQIAIFEEGFNANLGMDKGVLFSTGDAVVDLNSRNKSLSVYSSIGKEYSDPDLIKIDKGVTKDVVVYTFDVTLAAHTSALRVAFQFGSEEYPNFVGSQYNDAFGFFVSGPGIVDDKTNKPIIVNMARNPLNSNNISVNTINVGYRGKSSYYPTPVDLTNSSLYINNGHPSKTELKTFGSNQYYQIVDNNDANTNKNTLSKPVFIEYNGLTKLITYDLTGLKGGETYHFKIAIADASDTGYDSGVIIQKIQGTTGADVKIEKTIDKASVKAGENVEFTLTATNLGPYDGTGVKVTDLLPNGYSFVSATPSTGKFDEKTGVWTIGKLTAIHETATLKVKALVNPLGDYTNKATITSNDPDPDPLNNTSEVTPKVDNGLSGFDCFNDIVGNGFTWVYNGEGGIKPPSNPVVKQIDQPATDGGFVLDIYKLDNSFNMITNGKQLYKEEIDFQKGKNNIRFKSDKGVFGDNDISAVWNINKGAEINLTDRTNNPKPAIRVVIDKDGVASIYGIRNTGGELEELETFDKKTKEAIPLNKVDWKKTGTGKDVNKIEVKQDVDGQTLMTSFGYGQQIKACETCTVEKEGELSKEANPNNVKPGEVINYTFNVKNLGDMEIHDVTIDDPLFGFEIKVDTQAKKISPDYIKIQGDANGNFILDRTEEWTFTVNYKVTANDIYKTKGVYNHATVNGIGVSNASKMPIGVGSKDPTPYKAGDIGWDPSRPNHTYVPLKGQSLFISNPHIYQKVK